MPAPTPAPPVIDSPLVVASATPPATAPGTPTAPTGPSLAAQTFVDQMLLNGVMLGDASNQRILVKTQSFGIGDTVNFDLKLKLTAVLPHDIIFADESGFQYHKRY
jgi:hypothetical protein